MQHPQHFRTVNQPTSPPNHLYSGFTCHIQTHLYRLLYLHLYLHLYRSYEVRLVLEMCELGSLRDAMDWGLFVQDGEGRSGSRRKSPPLSPLPGCDFHSPCWRPAPTVLLPHLLAPHTSPPHTSADGGLNFAAVLDVSLGVAKAMVHLHRQVSSVDRGMNSVDRGINSVTFVD